MPTLNRAALALLLLFPAATSAQDLDKAVSAVVRISGTKEGTPVHGSGFVVSLGRERATIVTAWHVIEGAHQLEVTFAAAPTERFPAGEVLGKDSDLAAFLVRGALPSGIQTLSFEVTKRPQLGDELFLVGFPAMKNAPQAPRRTLAGRSGTFLLVDQRIGEGFSGSPVLQDGRVVGVVTDTDDQTTYAVNSVVANEALAGWGVGRSESTISQAAPPPQEKPCKTGEEVTENGIAFVRICPGTFIMGSAENDPQAGPDEKPAHQVTLSEFWIGKTEITNEQYRRFDAKHQGDTRLPAIAVSWGDAKAACEHFGGRLPTEAEWEYAARAGSRTAWSFGDDEKQLGEYAWYGESSATPHPVGLKKPNDWGLQDMHGNVWEWVADWYGPYSSAAQSLPRGPATGEYRVLRGGAFSVAPRLLRSAVRNGIEPEFRGGGIGFRCVLGARRQP